jgi:hypothetical protein
MKKTILIFILVNITGLLFSLDVDEAWELLMNEEGGDILFLTKINLCIPGGENWIANRKDSLTYIYTISNDKKVTSIKILVFQELSKLRYSDYYDLEYDILEGIPGTKLGSKAAKFGDFNDDGKDEIFSLGVGEYSRCVIEGYDNERDIYYLLNDIFALSSQKSPPPVVFTNYHGTDGIAIQCRDHMENRYVWRFFAWNEEMNEYEKIKEIREDEIDFSIIITLKEIEENQNEIESETVEHTVITFENEQQKKTSNSIIENKKRNLIIFACIFTLVVVIILFLVMKKRNIF